MWEEKYLGLRTERIQVSFTAIGVGESEPKEGSLGKKGKETTEEKKTSAARVRRESSWKLQDLGFSRFRLSGLL